MNAYFKFAVSVLCGMLLGPSAAQAEEYFKMTPVRVELGASEGADAYWALPHDLTLKAGESYVLTLVNWSEKQWHVLMAPELENAVFRGKIMDLPRRVEIPAASFAQGIALPPGAMVEVSFLPYKEGRYKLFCRDRTHTAAGIDVAINVRH